MSNVFIPQDLVQDLLLRLPVKSLLRFKCVSKSWYSMIDGPEFIKSHLKRSELTESNMKLIAQRVKNKVYKLYSVDFKFSTSFKSENIQEINYPSILDDWKQITFIGSCHGLVCLVQEFDDNEIFLCNPSTRKFNQLPICSTSRYDGCIHGFGYDEVTNDYKVVMLVKYREEEFLGSFRVLYNYFIYSVKTNEWRKFDNFAYGSDLIWKCDNGVFVNGALHWLLRDHSILAFNLTSEGFKLLQPPTNLLKSPLLCGPVVNSVLGSFVGSSQHLIYTDRAASEMWVLMDYGTKDSWTQLDLSTLKPSSSLANLVLYNLEEQSCQKAKFPVGIVFSERASVYFESLVRVDAGGGNDGTAMRKRSTKEKENW